MNPFYLAEKKMNTLEKVETSTSLSKNVMKHPDLTVNSTNKYPSSEKRVLLGKANSCSNAVSSDCTGHCTFLTPKQFVTMLSQYERKCLPIIDCRSQIDFGCERISTSHNVNCRAKLIARKLIGKCLEDVVPNLSTVLKNCDIVILYDQSSDIRMEEKISSLPINLVVQAARKSNKKVYIIQGMNASLLENCLENFILGGLDAVKNLYPHLIECAVEVPREDFGQDCFSPTPDVIDKENFTMTQILPRIFVGM